MIQNKRQYTATKSQIRKLEMALSAAAEVEGQMPPEVYRAMCAGIQSQINDLVQELREYEALRKAAVLRLKSIEELPRILIEARIARHYTQKDLADKLKLTPQQIQRYEGTGYRSVSFGRLILIAKALDVNFEAIIPLRANAASAGNKCRCVAVKKTSPLPKAASPRPFSTLRCVPRPHGRVVFCTITDAAMPSSDIRSGFMENMLNDINIANDGKEYGHA